MVKSANLGLKHYNGKVYTRENGKSFPQRKNVILKFVCKKKLATFVVKGWKKQLSTSVTALICLICLECTRGIVRLIVIALLWEYRSAKMYDEVLFVASIEILFTTVVRLICFIYIRARIISCSWDQNTALMERYTQMAWLYSLCSSTAYSWAVVPRGMMCLCFWYSVVLANW